MGIVSGQRYWTRRVKYALAALKLLAWPARWNSDFTQLADSVFEAQSRLASFVPHFEACTLLIAEMKTQSACADASEPSRKLPFMEKQSGLEAQKTRLPGLPHTPEQSHIHSLMQPTTS